MYEIIHSQDYMFMKSWSFEYESDALLFAEDTFHLNEDESYMLSQHRTVNLPDSTSIDLTYPF